MSGTAAFFKRWLYTWGVYPFDKSSEARPPLKGGPSIRAVVSFRARDAEANEAKSRTLLCARANGDEDASVENEMRRALSRSAGGRGGIKAVRHSPRLLV